MFIELTDHLRCTEEHDEAYLVLLPDQVEGRRVLAGSLGCPVCGRIVDIRGGVVDFGGGVPAALVTRIPPEGAAALLGIAGPGGFVALVDTAGTLADPVAEALPGVHVALVNPGSGTVGSATASVLRASRMPIRRASMRAAIIGGRAAADPEWVQWTVELVLPGNRIVVEGPRREVDGVEILAETGGLWVARRLH